MSGPRLSALVVARDAAPQLAECLATLGFADEVAVVLDRCADGTAAVARGFADTVIEGAWESQGGRRNRGIDACTGDWIVEVDADERVTVALAAALRRAVALPGPAHVVVPFDNYVAGRLVRHGWGAPWGVASTVRLFTRGCKRWGPERVHPTVVLSGERRRLDAPMVHLMGAGVSDLIRRLDRYSTARATDLRDRGAVGTLPGGVRRFFSRFLKCYVTRRGYREGAMGFLNALCAGLFPLLAHLKARLDR
ncbi:MAG: glycosyltransferase family 2 protein [Alphaproteobacteria bacterium]|nr:glycosyltransferase family 2 protein [Alphaproteobacteria bacterium]